MPHLGYDVSQSLVIVIRDNGGYDISRQTLAQLALSWDMPTSVSETLLISLLVGHGILHEVKPATDIGDPGRYVGLRVAA